MRRLADDPPLALSRGSGAWLYDETGRRYLDAISSWWVNLFGHCHPFIGAAVADQLGRLEHAMLAGCTHGPVVELSERLSALTGGRLSRCFYASDGASAVEIALKMSFHCWRNAGSPEKREFACLRGGYHGETLGALAVTNVGLFREPYAPLLFRTHLLEAPDLRSDEPGPPGERSTARDAGERSTALALAAAERLLQEHSERLAALIVEPLVQCAGGMVMHAPAYVRGLRGLCDRYRVHLIADEIAVGCGRTGTFFACEQAGIWPDFLCLSKGISGGYLPLSVVMTGDDVFAAFYDEDVGRAFLHSHSYTGNPLACRAALASLELFERDAVLARNQATAARLTRALEPLRAQAPGAGLRRCGMIWAFEVALENAAAQARFARRLQQAARERELLLRPIGPTVYLMPPYILDDEEVDFLAAGTLGAVAAALRAD